MRGFFNSPAVRKFTVNNGFPASNSYSGSGNFIFDGAILSQFNNVELKAVDSNFIFDEQTAIIGIQVDPGTAGGNFIFDVKHASDQANSTALTGSGTLILQDRARYPDQVGVDIYDEGILRKSNATIINFIGGDVLAECSGSFTGGGDVFVPPPDFVISIFTVTPTIIELGTIVNSWTLDWAYSPEGITSQTLTGVGVTQPALVDRTQTNTTQIINTETWQLDAESTLGVSATATTSMTFGARQYWGKAAVVPTTGAEIIMLPDSLLVTGKTSPIDFLATGVPEFMVFAYPEPYGDLGTVVDPATNFQIPTVFVGLISVTNGLGYTLDYRLYRGFNQTAGAFTWMFASTSGVALPDPSTTPAPTDSLFIDGFDWLAVDGADYLKVQ